MDSLYSFIIRWTGRYNSFPFVDKMTCKGKKTLPNDRKSFNLPVLDSAQTGVEYHAAPGTRPPPPPVRFDLGYNLCKLGHVFK